MKIECGANRTRQKEFNMFSNARHLFGQHFFDNCTLLTIRVPPWPEILRLAVKSIPHSLNIVLDTRLDRRIGNSSVVETRSAANCVIAGSDTPDCCVSSLSWVSRVSRSLGRNVHPSNSSLACCSRLPSMVGLEWSDVAG